MSNGSSVGDLGSGRGPGSLYLESTTSRPVRSSRPTLWGSFVGDEGRGSQVSVTRPTCKGTLSGDDHQIEGEAQRECDPRRKDEFWVLELDFENQRPSFTTHIRLNPLRTIIGGEETTGEGSPKTYSQDSPGPT